MTLVYQSTRDENNKVTASQAILQGLATDGGLFTPLSTPEVTLDFDQLKDASYQEVAKLVLSAFLDDFTEEELDYCITNAYDDKFDTAAIAPVVKLKNHYNLELFHGSTIAFKDMALSILPYLLTTSAKKQGVDNKIVILTATSGDTGKAAMAGFADVPGTEIIVFYPSFFEKWDGTFLAFEKTQYSGEPQYENHRKEERHRCYLLCYLLMFLGNKG